MHHSSSDLNPLFMSFSTDQIFSRCTKLYFFVTFAPSPCLPHLTQEVHNNWGQTQEAGHAVVLESYFSYPLLPSQGLAASGSPPEQLHILLHDPPKSRNRMTTLHFLPFSLRKQTVLIFPSTNPCCWNSAVKIL